MHDVVTHRVSLMVLQVGALRVTAPDEPTRKAAEELRAAGCLALDELRDLVGVLRTTSDGDRTPQEAHPSTAELATLAAESTAVGLPTELVEDGDPQLASPVVGRTVYRIVQEALTNARKHAPGARVTVQVRYNPANVRVTIRSTPPTQPADAGLVGTGSGMGLVALRKRIELVGDAAPTRIPMVGSWWRQPCPPTCQGVGARPRVLTVAVRVVVVDDEPMVCAHLRTILGSADDLEVVEEAHDGAGAVEAVLRTRPDVVLMDCACPVSRAHGDRADQQALRPAGGGRADNLRRRPVRAAGAGRRRRFLVRRPPEDLIGLVRVAAAGNMSPAAARRLVTASADQHSTRQRAQQLVESLTERELEVLACLGEGLSNAQIAARLYLSEATVKGYVSRMLDKLGCANRTQAGLLAHDASIVQQ